MKTTTFALFTTLALGAGAAAADLPKAASLTDAVSRAELFAARQSWTGAIAAYREAIAAAPKDPVLRNRLGICYQRMGDTGAARAAYRKALELKKDYAEVHNNLGTLDHSRGKLKQAIAAYETAIRIEPTDAVFHKNLGSAWLARGRVEKALEAWGEAFRLDPLSFESETLKVPAPGVDVARQYYLFAKLLAARGEVEKALAYLTKAHAAGFDEFAKLEADRDFAPVVSDPRYAALK